MVKPAAKQTVTTYNSHSCPKQRCFFSSSFPSSSPLLSFPSSFHHLLILFLFSSSFLPHPHFISFFSSPISLFFFPFFLFSFFPLFLFSSSLPPLSLLISLLYRNPAICYFSYSFLRSTFYHHLFDVMRLQRYAFIGQMTLLSSKIPEIQTTGAGRDRSAPVNHGTSADIGAL